MRVYEYKKPLDLGFLLDEKMMYGYMVYTAEQIKKMDRKFEGIVTIAKNEEYGFLLVDYGFLIKCLSDYFRDMLGTLGQKNKDEIADKILMDFSVDTNEQLTKNGKHFIQVMNYYGLSFENKKAKSFYARSLYKNLDKDEYTILNSIPFNYKEFQIAIGSQKFSRNISGVLDNQNIDLIGIGGKANIALKLLPEKTMIYQYWSRNEGINDEMFN